MPMRKRKPVVEEDSANPTTASSSSDEGASASETPAPPGKTQGKSDLFLRTLFTFVMAILFLTFLYVGQTLGIVLVVFCQVLMFREVMRINRKKSMESELPVLNILSWYMFISCNFFTVTSSLRNPLVQTWPWLDGFFKNSNFIAFTLYMLGLVVFVLSLKPIRVLGTLRQKLKRGAKTAPAPKQIYFRYQFNQFGWLHMGMLAFSVMSSFFFTTMMDGMIWFALPVSCVVQNDSWAYACGKLFGSVPLIPTLSPKKTWEGFLGAWFFTTLWAFWFADFLSNHKRFICPKEYFLRPIECEVSSTFLPTAYELPEFLWGLFGQTVMLKPVQLHGVAFAAFASLGAPFGGFFASGLKRAFNLKDFGDLIPGHGGMIDRMDCQVLMALFVYSYVSNFVSEGGGVCATSGMFSYCLTRLDDEQKLKLYTVLGNQLKDAGVALPAL